MDSPTYDDLKTKSLHDMTPCNIIDVGCDQQDTCTSSSPAKRVQCQNIHDVCKNSTDVTFDKVRVEHPDYDSDAGFDCARLLENGFPVRICDFVFPSNQQGSVSLVSSSEHSGDNDMTYGNKTKIDNGQTENKATNYEQSTSDMNLGHCNTENDAKNLEQKTTNDDVSTSKSYKSHHAIPSIEIEFIKSAEDERILVESELKKIFINKWARGIPQYCHTDGLSLPVFEMHPQDDQNESTTVVGSLPTSSVSQASSGYRRSSSSLEDTPDNMYLGVRLSVISLSSLSIEDYLLRPNSNNASPSMSPVGSRKSMNKSCEDVSQSTRMNDLSPSGSSVCLESNSRNSSLHSLSRLPVDDPSDSSRRPSLENRSTSPISGNAKVGSCGLLPRSTDSQKSSISNASGTSSLYMSVYSSTNSSSRKSSNADRMSDTSEVSSASLLDPFRGEADSNSSSTIDPAEELDRMNSPSPSPFCQQLKYFQDKRKNQMFLVKTTAARLGLNTKRKSYTLWRERHLDSKGRPVLKKPEISVGKATDAFTKERVTAITDAMEWIREELQLMREQDDSLARQFLEIRRKIHEVKLDWSCEQYKEMLEDVEDEITETKNLKRVSDRPEFHTKEHMLRDIGMTRRNIGNRKYSIL